jgi:hypothetical protein
MKDSCGHNRSSPSYAKHVQLLWDSCRLCSCCSGRDGSLCSWVRLEWFFAHSCKCHLSLCKCMGRIEDMNGIPGVLMFRMRLSIHINWKSESYAFNFLILPYVYIYIFTPQHPLAHPAKTEESKSHAECLDGNFATGLANLRAKRFRR